MKKHYMMTELERELLFDDVDDDLDTEFEDDLLDELDDLLDESEEVDEEFDENLEDDMDEEALYDDSVSMLYPNADEEELEEELESLID